MATDTTLDGWKPASRISGNTRTNLAPTWTFTILWNLVSVPLLVYIPPELARNPLAAIGFLFPIVGAGLLVWAIMATLRWRRFGQTWFDMTTMPAVPGGRLAGTVHVRLDPPSGAEPLTRTCQAHVPSADDHARLRRQQHAREHRLARGRGGACRTHCFRRRGCGDSGPARFPLTRSRQRPSGRLQGSGCSAPAPASPV